MSQLEDVSSMYSKIEEFLNHHSVEELYTLINVVISVKKNGNSDYRKS